MNDKLNQTQKILRSPKVTTDDRGRTVWVDPIETAKLELVSTQMLKQIIDADNDGDDTKRLQAMASNENGLVARDVNDGRFEIINDEELQHILNGTEDEYTAKHAAEALEKAPEESPASDDEFELVSTQMLRAILGNELVDENEEIEESNFNPYDNN